MMSRDTVTNMTTGVLIETSVKSRTICRIFLRRTMLTRLMLTLTNSCLNQSLCCWDKDCRRYVATCCSTTWRQLLIWK